MFLSNMVDWDKVPGPSQFSKLQFINNQLCQDYSTSFFEKVNKGQLKMMNVNY